MGKLLINKAKCLLCGDVLESVYRHDSKTCQCGNLSVDGGKDYIRRSYREEDSYEELSEEVLAPDFRMEEVTNY